MTPSRRVVVSAVGTALGSGCSALGGGDAEQTALAPIESFEAELRAPEMSRALFTKSDVASASEINDSSGSPGLPITLTDEAMTTVTEQFRAVGVAESPANSR